MIYRVMKESKGRYETLYFGSKNECEHYLSMMKDKKGAFVERAYGYYDEEQKKYYRYGEVYRNTNQ